MKKRYMSPQVHIVYINTNCSILAGSLPNAVENGYDFELEVLAPEFSLLEESK